MTHRSRIKRVVRSGLATALVAGLIPAPAHAGERLARLSSIFGREPAAEAAPDAGPSGAIASRFRWMEIPRPARVAAKKLAASKDASVTRCVAIEGQETVTYEIYAAHREGLFRRTEFLLTGVTEPKSVAEDRARERTFERRMTRFRQAMNRSMWGPNGPPERAAHATIK